MIVVDTNTIAHVYLPTGETLQAEAVLAKDADWAAPLLWRGEMRNVLTQYVKRQMLDFETACEIQERAEMLLGGNEYEVGSFSVLSLARLSGCTAYDCEFVFLAQALGTTLVTADRQVLHSFPETAITADAYLAR